MNTFKAFAQIGALTDNATGVVAPVGELSPLSKTFTRVMTEHTLADFPGETLVGFSYKVDGVATIVPDATVRLCLTAINWIYTQARLGTFTESKDTFQQAFITNFGTTLDLINSGLMIGFEGHFAPEYVEFAPLNMSATNSFRIWFADDSFFNQYDEFTILVIPPIAPVDQFFQDYGTVKDLIAAIKYTDQLTKVAAARGKLPETVLRADTFEWRDKVDHTLLIETDWTTVIYGAAGDNLDAVKEAIRDYILDNSTHTRDEWADVFPDLFTSTEFIITPMWNDYSVPNGNKDTGVYSGIVAVQAAMALCHKTCQGVKYTNAQIDACLSVVPSQYRSLMLSVVGGPENRDGVDLFAERFPDYMNVYTTHVDFMRMSDKTRQFVMLLAEMLMHAEELTLNSGVPAGFNRLVRNDVVYLSRTFDKFLYLVTTKASVVALS